MPSEKTSNTKLGIFVTVAALLFSVAVFYIGNQQNLFGSKFLISSRFQNINGLQNGNNVRFSGISVGNVDDIIILSDSVIQVDMLLDKSVQEFIKKDAIASIASDGLVGNMIVNITSGKGGLGPVKDGDVINSYSRAETDDILGTLGKTTENIEILSRNLLVISESIMNGHGVVSQLLSNSEMSNEMVLTFINLRKTSASIEELSHQLADNIASSAQGKGALGYLFTDSLLSNQVYQITSSLDTLISVKTEPIMQNLDRSSSDIAAASAELKRLMQDLKLDNGLIDAVLHDEDVKTDFQETIHNLNEGTDRFSESMEALKHNFLFRGYFRKQERKQRKAEKAADKEKDIISSENNE